MSKTLVSKTEMEAIVKAWQEKHDNYESGYSLMGIRFEDADHEVGYEYDYESKDNSDREDERDFPDFECDEYDEMPTMGGISTWDLEGYDDFEDSNRFLGYHCYIVGGEDGHRGTFDILCDEGELVIEYPTVVAKLW